MRRALLITAACLVTAGFVACDRSTPSTTPVAAPAAGDSATDAPAAPSPKTLTLDYDRSQKPVVGTSILATAEGLAPGHTVNLVWATVDGGWVIEDYFHFRGKKFTETTRPLAQATVDANGRLSARFAIPEDFGGVHEILAQDSGVTVALGGVEVGQTFELSPREGPIGTPIELRVTGLGWRTMESTWVVNWDNREVGFVSAASSRGTAVARFRASGNVGDHVVNLLTGYTGQAYLNYEQAPTAYLPRPSFAFRLTPGRAAPVHYAEPYQRQPMPVAEGGEDAPRASITPSQGPVNSRVAVKATGLPAGQQVALVWGTARGSRVSGNGFESTEQELMTATVDASGTLTVPLVIPDDLGGLHSLAIRSGGKTLALAHFAIETSIVGMTPASGTVGTTVTIHLKGVGWTEYDNIYIATYDNAYMGYACGFNSNGDVVINFPATGPPGVHLIDLYPGIYQGPADGQPLYRLPQLTYADDHPGNKIPALRFAFEVTPGPAARPAR